MNRLVYLALAVLLASLLICNVSLADERDLLNGPDYADVKSVRLRRNEISIIMYGYIPGTSSLSGRLYIDSDSNVSTGCTWPFEKGADYLALFVKGGAKSFRWKGEKFLALANLSTSFSGNVIDIVLPPTLKLIKPRLKLWVTITVSDPFMPVVIGLNSLKTNYVTLLNDGVDQLPGWLDLMRISGKLKGDVLWISLTYRSTPLPKLNGSSFDALAGLTIMIDGDGNPKTGFRGAEYALTLKRMYAKRPFLELSINGELDRWNGSNWVFERTIPGSLVGNNLIYEIALRGLNLSKNAKLIIAGGSWAVLRDYFPNNYFLGGWVNFEI
ncbi:MAG: hypothetical protein B6U69_01420 [Thermofilum sp. ex4484_15]|nr:MAG: hypothetical protein B6U69_01420 [Thermofilum sp. ex4484_15]